MAEGVGQMKKVILIRGIPGCGKSWYSKFLLKEKYWDYSRTVCSADDFFYVRVSQVGECEYRYDPYKIGEAHADCFSRFLSAIKTGINVVMVDNTFVHWWEMKNYIMVAENAGYAVEIHEIRVLTVDQVNQCVKRNSHGVPADTIARMAMQFEQLPNNDPRLTIVPFKEKIV